jgi:GDP-4-dehydro-6-deoxy-D-mannose reductase
MTTETRHAIYETKGRAREFSEERGNTMKVLITGITGFVGSHLLDYITKISESASPPISVTDYKTGALIVPNPAIKVYGLKRPRSPMDNIYSSAELLDCDITDYHSVQAVINTVKPDRIFHLAAQSYVPLSWAAPQATFTINVLGTLNILEAMRQKSPNARMLFAGSSEEYGMVKPSECPITEDQPLRPLSPYGVSKVAGELLCRQYVRSYNLHVVTTRAFNHTGPRRGDVFATSDFAKQIARIEKGLAKPTITVGNLEAQRDWTDVRDMVHAYWLALEHCVPGEPYNVCSGRTISISDMLHILLGLSRVKMAVVNDPARMRPSDVPLLRGSSDKFHQLTGWKPTIPFAKTLQDLLDYWREKV